MPETKAKRTSLLTRKGVHDRSNKRKRARRKASIRAKEEAPRVVGNSPFALTLQPKTWATLPHQNEDPKEIAVYRDLVRAYNQGAELKGIEKIIYKQGNTSTAAIAELLNLFKQNICPAGFEVNIDEHYHRKTNVQHFHFSIYKEISFPNYWHFFELKHIVLDLKKTNTKLHDLFIVWLRSFIYWCSIPSWFEGPMADSQYVLSNYTAELSDMLEKKDTPEVKAAMENNGYSEKEMRERLAAIEKTMKVYATGEAQDYMQMLIKTKPVKPHYLLRSLKKFAPQHKLVKFMKNGCELMKEIVGINDFCYERASGDDYECLSFDQQVTIIWDWHDHYTGCYSRHMEDLSYQLYVGSPTLCASILPSGTYGLNIEELPKHVEWPKKLSALQGEFQKIAERFTNYNERDLK